MAGEAAVPQTEPETLNPADAAARALIIKNNPSLESKLKVVPKEVVKEPVPEGVVKDPVIPPADNTEAEKNENTPKPPSSDENPLDVILGGKYKGKAWADVESDINTYNENSQKTSMELDGLRKRTKELELAVSVKPTDDTPDDILSFREFKRQHPDLSFREAAVQFDTIANYDITKTNPLDILKMQYRLQNPKSAASDEAIERTINKRYGLDGIDETHEDYQVAQDMMVSDANKAMSDLKAKKDGLVVKRTDSDALKIVEETKTSWKPIIETMVKEDFNFSLVPQLSDEEFRDLSPGDKKAYIETAKYDVRISKAELSALSDEAMNYAITNKLPLEEKSLEAISNFIKLRYLAERIPDVVHNVRKSRDAYWKAEVDKQVAAAKEAFYNPKNVKGKTDTTIGGGKKELSPDQKKVNATLAAVGKDPMY